MKSQSTRQSITDSFTQNAIALRLFVQTGKHEEQNHIQSTIDPKENRVAFPADGIEIDTIAHAIERPEITDTAELGCKAVCKPSLDAPRSLEVINPCTGH